jgi:tight adherence protein B
LSSSHLQNDTELLHTLSALLNAGLPVPLARKLLSGQIAKLDSSVRRNLELILNSSERYGSSAATPIAALLDAVSNKRQLAEQIALASSTPNATAKVVLWLPVGTLLVAQLAGANVLAAARSPWVLASLATGALLLWANHKILARITRGALGATDQLLATFDASFETIARVSAGLPLPKREAAADFTEPDFEALAERYGLERLPLLRHQMQARQQRIMFDLQLRVAALSIKLLLPIGLLTLPVLAFLAIIPVSYALITN